MNIICEAKELKQVCRIARTFKRTTLPATNYITIDATNGKVVAKAANLEQMVFYNLKAEVIERGGTSIPIKRSLRFATFEKDRIGIRSGEGTQNGLRSMDGNLDRGMVIKLYNRDMGDPVPVPETGECPIILPDNFQQRMRWALQCVAKEESRPILTGVLFEYDKEKQVLDMASADGRWLIRVSTPLEYDGESFRVIIPQSAISLVSKYMQGNLRFGFNKDRVWFENDTMKMISQTIRGTFPQYQSLIPSGPPSLTLTLSAPLLYQRLSQMFCDECLNIVRLSLTEDGMLKLSSKDEVLEEDEALIPATIKGEGKIAFNRQYLLEVSRLFAEMTIEITAVASPMKITGDLNGVTLIVMPVFVQW